MLIQKIDVYPSKVLEEDGNSDDLFNMYNKIAKAEASNGLTNQEVIRYYYHFGKALLGRFEYHRLLHLDHEAQKKKCFSNFRLMMFSEKQCKWPAESMTSLARLVKIRHGYS